jgi:hypothetical protein
MIIGVHRWRLISWTIASKPPSVLALIERIGHVSVSVKEKAHVGFITMASMYWIVLLLAVAIVHIDGRAASGRGRAGRMRLS